MEAPKSDMSQGASAAGGGGDGGASPQRKTRRKMTEAERVKEMEAAALNAAILKPFLESLFADEREGGSGGGGGGGGSGAGGRDDGTKRRKIAEEELHLAPATGATVGMSGMPSMRYPEALQRECAKPFRLSTLVSIDAAPLPTRTAPPVYMELQQMRTGELPQHAACLNHDYREQLRRSFAQGKYATGFSPSRRMAHQLSNDGDGGGNEPPIEIEIGPGQRAVANFTGQARPPDLYGPVKQGQMLEDAHLEGLLRTVQEVRQRQLYEKMWTNADRVRNGQF